MVASYRKVHYAQRPAKNIERKMIVDALLRFQSVTDVSKFRYVGLGSIYFTDFGIVHRLLGTRDLISIEKAGNKDTQQRFLNNKPLDCIDLRFGHTNQLLPKLFSVPGKVPSVVWLDYDGQLENATLTDISTVLTNAPPLSVLIISLQVQPDPDDTKRVGALKANLDGRKIPRSVQSGADLAGRKLSTVVRQIISNETTRAVRTRNAGRPAADRLVARQIFHFNYADDAAMLTVGWVLVTPALSAELDKTGIDELDFTSSDEQSVDIVVPNLTTREALALESQMPPPITSGLIGVPDADISAYERLYRFFPTFVDATL